MKTRNVLIGSVLVLIGFLLGCGAIAVASQKPDLPAYNGEKQVFCAYGPMTGDSLQYDIRVERIERARIMVREGKVAILCTAVPDWLGVVTTPRGWTPEMKADPSNKSVARTSFASP